MGYDTAKRKLIHKAEECEFYKKQLQLRNARSKNHSPAFGRKSASSYLNPPRHRSMQYGGSGAVGRMMISVPSMEPSRKKPQVTHMRSNSNPILMAVQAANNAQSDSFQVPPQDDHYPEREESVSISGLGPLLDTPTVDIPEIPDRPSSNSLTVPSSHHHPRT